QMKSALSNIPVQRAMVTRFNALSPNDPIAHAVEHIRTGFQQDFPVVEGEHVVGVLTRSDLLSALAHHRPDALVGEVMNREFETPGPFDMLSVVMSRLQESNCRTVPVVHGGRLVGLLSIDHMSETLLVQEADRKRRASPVI